MRNAPCKPKFSNCWCGASTTVSTLRICGTTDGYWRRVLSRAGSAPWFLGAERSLAGYAGEEFSDEDLDRYRTAAGLYVWLTAESAHHDVERMLPLYALAAPGLVLVECQVHPADWLYSARTDNPFYRDAATYRTVKPVAILKSWSLAKDGSGVEYYAENK
jgi:hypothetical protein